MDHDKVLTPGAFLTEFLFWSLWPILEDRFGIILLLSSIANDNIYIIFIYYHYVSYIFLYHNTISYPSDKVTAAVFSWSRTKWLSCRQNCKNPVCSSHETRSPIKTQTCHAQNLSEEDSVQISQKGRRGGVWFFRFEPKPYCHAQICWGCANLSTIGEGAHSDTNMYHCR